jgi:serine/threonine protein kinase
LPATTPSGQTAALPPSAPSGQRTGTLPASTPSGQATADLPAHLLPSTIKGAIPPDARIIRGYRLLDKLGSGTFGVVYRALSSGGVDVAIKEISYSLDQPQSKRELDALELIKGLRHAYLLAIHDFWVENNKLYIAMELADSTLGQLGKQYAGAGVPRSQLLSLFEEAAEAFDYLHEHHVLHRDVKPANILLLNGHVKVADLGLAKHNPQDVAVTQNVAGTPAYMAPETLRNEYRKESDQYALALCYAELRLGRRVCDASTVPSAVAWHLYGTPKLEGLKPNEAKAVARALSKKPEQRFTSCQEFVTALQEPKPAVAPDRSWWAVIALLIALPLVILVVALLPQPRPPSTENKPSAEVDWLPPENFKKPDDAKIPQPIDGRRYYDRLVRRIGDKDVEFVLIPCKKPLEQRPFYIMKYKVSNGLFKAAAADAGFQKQLEELKGQYAPSKLEWDRWHLGGKGNGNVDVGDADDTLPVLRVNVLEAWCFARWVGGNLPTVQEWKFAGGAAENDLAPYHNPQKRLEEWPEGEFALKRGEKGPMPVGKASRDYSRYDCWDMAGNGQEWTRDRYPIGGAFRWPPPVVPASEAANFKVCVCGHNYSWDEPYTFAEYATYTDSKDFQRAIPFVGFRVVLEQQ